MTDTESPAAVLRQAAGAIMIRADCGPGSFWSALADLLEARAAEYDEYARGPYGEAGAAFVAGDAGGDPDPALAVARAYLLSREDGHGA